MQMLLYPYEVSRSIAPYKFCNGEGFASPMVGDETVDVSRSKISID